MIRHSIWRRAVLLAAVAAWSVWLDADAAAVIVHDTTTVATGASVDTVKWSHTVGNGTNRYMVVGVAVAGTIGSISVTYAGQSLATIGAHSSNSQVHGLLFELVNPPTGTADVIVAFPTTETVALGASSFFGVDQSTPWSTRSSLAGMGSPAGVNLTSSTDELVVDFVAVDNGVTIAADPPQSELWNQSATSVRGGGSLAPGVAGPFSTSWTFGSNVRWVAVGASLQPAQSASLTVDTELDSLDGDTSSISTLLANKGVDSLISLREAIIACNNTAGLDTIKFSIAGAGPHSIQPTSELPTISDSIFLNGYSQPGASPSTLAFPNAMDAVLKIEIDGTLVAGTGAVGLKVSAGNSTIRGLAINNFTGPGAYGIYILTNGGNTLEGNFIGTDVSGTADAGNGGYAVFLDTDSNLVGGTAPGSGNLVSGNANYGFRISGNANRLEGNFIGTDITGTQDLGNIASGVGVFSGKNIIIGGSAAGAGNLISGNDGHGIWFNSSPDSVTVQGNRIGTDISGTLKVSNGGSGVSVNCPNVLVGGTTPGAGNLISGNNQGITISSLATNTDVQGNYIGTMVGGTGNLGNTGVGIQVGTPANLIGGTSVAARNVISANGGAGVVITGASATGNVVRGNYIGTDTTGNVDLGNVGNGISVLSSAINDTIGGTASGAGNVIVGNNGVGISLVGLSTQGHVILGNRIGINAAGTAAITNGEDGIEFSDASDNVVGGAAVGARNVICAANGKDCIAMTSVSTSGNIIRGNYLGTNASGTAMLAGGTNGIGLLWASNTIIGGDSAGEGNVIGGYLQSGISGIGTGTLIQGNAIGTDTSGVLDLTNGMWGITVSNSASNWQIGGDTGPAGNIIANNSNEGVRLAGTACRNIRINRNSIFASGNLGIDLDDDGVTPNDAGDSDSGSNDLQNYPVLDSAITNGIDTIIVYGSLNSTASDSFRLELFASDSADTSGYGEGEVFLGDTTVTTNGSGDVGFSVTLSAAVAVGQSITATATDTAGNTSEFSLAITAAALPSGLWVDTNADSLDGDTSSVAALLTSRGADGKISLREAIIATNNTAGLDTIRFNIAGPGPHTILPDSALRAITDPLLIDGYSQPGAATNTAAAPGALNGTLQIEIDGSAAGPSINGLTIQASGTTIRGLTIHSFSAYGIYAPGPDSITLTGNYIGTDVTGSIDKGNTSYGSYANSGSHHVIGGSLPSERNLISGNGTGVFLWNGSGSRIQGNIMGLAADGVTLLGNTTGFQATAHTSVQIGGAAPGEANLISGNSSSGIYFAGVDSGKVQGNFIGTDATLLLDRGNGTGILLYNGTSESTVGGSGAGEGNLISGNSIGIRMWSSGSVTSNNSIMGNTIGVDTAGNPLGNGTGIDAMAGTDSTYVGGAGPNDGNLIAYNTGVGVRMAGIGAVNRNTIHSNGGLGLDVGTAGVTANSDADSVVDYPVITSATESGGLITANFDLDLPAGGYRIELYKNPGGGDPTGHGEGEQYVSFVDIYHTGSGPESFMHSFSGAAGDSITATTTECSDSACTSIVVTSEFGVNVEVVSGGLSVAVSKPTFSFGVSPTNQWLPSDSSLVINDGSVAENFVGQISTFTDGSNTWTVSNTATGADSVRAQWSITSATGPWTDIAAYDSDFTISTNVAASDTVTVWFRIQTPISTSSFNEHSSTLTATAEAF